MKPHTLALTLGLSLAFASYPFAAGATDPKLMLASDYREQLDLDQFLMSEKLDGVRAYWDGSRLLSRSGNPIHAPSWFVDSLPVQELEGELWMGRGQFEALLSVVRDLEPDEQGWRQVQFHLFDLPGTLEPFWQRNQRLQRIVEDIRADHIKVVPQHPVGNRQQLQAALARITRAGGEGLMLHHRNSAYQPGRSGNLVKVKSHADAEAVVVRHLPGKGKYQGMMGAIVVETPDGVRFRIGSGFSDAERLTPPEIGSVITFRYNGYTERGIPRFARYLRPHPML